MDIKYSIFVAVMFAIIFAVGAAIGIGFAWFDKLPVKNDYRATTMYILIDKEGKPQGALYGPVQLGETIQSGTSQSADPPAGQPE